MDIVTHVIIISVVTAKLSRLDVENKTVYIGKYNDIWNLGIGMAGYGLNTRPKLRHNWSR